MAGCPSKSSAVTINLLPSQAHQATTPNRQAYSVGLVQVWESSLTDDLKIEGPRDVAVQQYSEWLQTQYQDPSFQEEVRKAEQAVLDERFSLVQIYRGRGSDFLAGKVKRDIAESFMNDVPVWNKRRKATHREYECDSANQQFDAGQLPCIVNSS